MYLSADPLNLLTEALVEANDQLAGLLALVHRLGHLVALDESMPDVIEEVRQLLTADAMMVQALGTLTTGAPDQVARLIAIPGSTAVDPDDWTVLSTSVDLSGDQVLWMTASRAGEAFTTAHRSLFEAAAQVLAGAIRVFSLHQAELNQALIRQEHTIASVLAQGVLRLDKPALPGLSVVARCEPARTAGGDFYHVDCEEGLLYLCLGDVAGKGLPAAVSMVQVATACSIAFSCRRRADPRAIMRDVDRCLYPRLDELSSFVTLVIGTYNTRSHELRLVNAGHGPVILRRKDEVLLVPACTPPLGVVPLDPDVEHRFVLEPGDRLVIASDGLTEQADPDGRLFGDDRLVALTSARPSELFAMVDGIYKAVEAHAEAVAQSDDRTVLALERLA